MARTFTLLLLLLRSFAGNGQLVINEVCSKNVSVLLEADGSTPDWVELYNAGAEPLDLSGYFLSDDPDIPDQWQLPMHLLEPGAFLVLLHGTNNGDGRHFPFKLDGDGEALILTDAAYLTVDQQEVPSLRPDHSAGRNAFGTWSIFDQPTVGAENSAPAYTDYAPKPTFGVAPGLHDGPVNVAIAGCSDCAVHYTTDGAPPSEGSPSAAGALLLTQATTLKAIAYREGALPSEVSAATYVIGAPTSLPVISLSAHPDSLFDDTLGIYMMGPEADTAYPHLGANFWDERGIDVRFEYYDEHHIRRIEQDVELRIHGGRASRNKPQRPLRLTARDAYGDDLIRYGFFPEKPELEGFKRIILRNSGSDWCQAHYRDGFFHQTALHAGLDIDVLGFKPAVVYINGQYWGILNIRERVDADYLGNNHDADKDALLLMDEENNVIQGDSLHFDSLQHYIRTHDMADDEHFQMADSLLDLPSFMDYYALEMFSGNSDWPSNNLKYWKPSAHTGKWRYLMYDMDATMAAAPWLPNDFDMFYWVHVHREGFIHAEIYQSLVQRPEFRRLFLNRLADLMNTCLRPEALLAENERIRSVIRSEVPRHFERWGGNVSTWHVQSEEVIPAWAQARAGHMREDVLEWYDLPNTASIRFDVFPPNAGRVRVNTLTPELPFDGIYFNGNDIDVHAEAAPGSRFSHWSYSAEPGTPLRQQDLKRSFAYDGQLVAHFAREGTTLYALPNPTTGACEVSFETDSAGPLELSLWGNQGQLIWRWSAVAVAGVNRLPVDLSLLAPGLYEVSIEYQGTRRAVRLVKQ